MCGIYTIGTSCNGTNENISTSSLEKDFFEQLNNILSFNFGVEKADKLRPSMLLLGESAFKFLQRRPQLETIVDRKLAANLSKAASDLMTWVLRTEDFVKNTPLSQREEEDINFLIVSARDIEWRISKDILFNTEKIGQLLGPEPAEENSLSHLWAMNLILNNLDRLEVRGRDSAGIATYIHFTSSNERDSFLKLSEVKQQVRKREPDGAFRDMSITCPFSNPHSLLFTFKVAEEVGEIGQNVSQLRKKITEDSVFQKAIRKPGTELNAIAHTRWASNGIISIPNCHPVNSTTFINGGIEKESSGNFIAALNGDIDNYQELLGEILSEGRSIHKEITTDAKMIPVMMSHLCGKGLSIQRAFDEMIDRFEGSMAIALLAAERPNEFFLAQKGSGQGLFIAPAGDSVAAASEMYGIVELTDQYIKANGEKSINNRTRGERFHVSFTCKKPQISLISRKATKNTIEERTISNERAGRAEITTRDIDRGDYPRYLLKEINESVQSVEKTFRGKIIMEGKESPAKIRINSLSPDFLKHLKEGKIHKIITTGQGTAAVAAEGIASLLEDSVGNSTTDSRIKIQAMKATELSTYSLREDMSDTLIIAVSQSGTTTDTNRTIDLARSRGAYIIAIVNRRNSDLAYKANDVIYTSDGRDIEMSVASTKAFYSQNMAGQLLALSLAEHLKSKSPAWIQDTISSIRALPEAMKKTLKLSDQIRKVAEKFAPYRRYWAIVGSGCGKIAADEIRIKLSELCYKAIAVDFLEDKKHIDLSSEPLIIICATGLPPSQVPDAVKEVAIFKAHNSIPIVITEEGEKRFDPYAASCIHVPRFKGSLNYLLPTMVGHLFGYHAASCFEDLAIRFRGLRKSIVMEALEVNMQETEPLTIDKINKAELIGETLKIQNLLNDGKLDSIMDTSESVKLNDLLNILLNRMSIDLLPLQFNCPGTIKNLLNITGKALSDVINRISRPIDAIKHQAKTVTVGISRLEDIKREGIIWSLISGLKLPIHSAPASVAGFLTHFGQLLSVITGSTLYEISGLNQLGRPSEETRIFAVQRRGIAEAIPSRFDKPKPLSGTKMQVVKERKIFLGLGSKDQRKILILPFITEKEEGKLLLVHFELEPYGNRQLRVNGLKFYKDHYERLVAAVTEYDIPWDDKLVDKIDNTTLFLKSPEEAASEIRARM